VRVVAFFEPAERRRGLRGEDSLSVFRFWLEVLLPVAVRWIPLDPVMGGVDHPRRIVEMAWEATGGWGPARRGEPALAATRASVPRGASARQMVMAHVVAVEGGTFTDVTRRYCRSWPAVQRRRAPGDWFPSVLERLNAAARSASREDDMRDISVVEEKREFERLDRGESIPKTVTAIKNHPAFVIEKHLYKHEVLRPKGPVVGFCGGSPVYPRSCVQSLHSQQRWERLMRSVLPDQLDTPFSHTDEGDRPERAPLALFGEWQTEPLRLAAAENGRVPVNSRGQVDVWTPQHVPHGCRHLSIRAAASPDDAAALALAETAARRLGIHAPRAMIGFEHTYLAAKKRGGGRTQRGSGTSNVAPVFDGVVVCADRAAEVLAASRDDHAKSSAAALVAARAGALRRWGRLVRALQAAEMVRERYGEPVGDTAGALGVRKRRAGNVEEEPPKKRSALEGHEHNFVEDVAATGVRRRRCEECGLLVEMLTA